MNLETELRNLVADQPFVPDIEIAVRRGRRLRRRSTAIRGAAVLSVVAGVTATAVALNQPAPPESAQVIVARTVAAITAQNGAYRITGADRQDIFDSIHQASEITDFSNGKPIWTQAVRTTGPGKFEMRVIDYQKRVWADTTRAAMGVVSGSQLADEFRQGCFKVVDTAVIDGQPADKLATCQPSATSTWISRATWLPISVESNGKTVTYQWFDSIDPSTTWPAVPAGFRQVQPTPELLYHN